MSPGERAELENRLIAARILARDAGAQHPITTFVQAAALMLAGQPESLVVRETLAGERGDYLLVEVFPAGGDYGKILGQRGVILDAVRLVARRMAQRDHVTVEVKLRDPRALEHPDGWRAAP